MTIVYPSSLIQHVVGFGRFGVLAGAVGVDVGAHVSQEVGAVAGCLEGGLEARELGAVLLEDLAVAGQVGGFQGGGCGFGVEEAGELLEEG